MNLLQLELRKLLPYRAFWVMMILFAALLAFVISSAQHIKFNGQEMGSGPFTFPEIFQNVAWLAGYLNLMLGILIIVLVTDEFQFRTFRQQVMDGLTRLQLVLAKIAVIGLVALIATGVVGALAIGFGMVGGPAFSDKSYPEMTYLGTFFVQAVGYMSLALLIAVLVRKSGLGILLFLLYTTLLERVIRWRLDDAQAKYLPVKVFDTLTPKPEGLEQVAKAAGMTSEILSLTSALAYTGLYALVFFGLTYLLLKVRDL